MALTFYMTLTGTSQGVIEGYNSHAGHEKEIQCHALDQSIQIPFNRETGQPTGKRIHGPLKITKSFDKASPLLYKALVEGEVFSDVTLTFFRILPTGSQENYYTITLTNAIIVEVRPIMYNHFDEELARYDHLEEVSFSYKQIEWRWEPDGIVSEDRMDVA